MKVLKFWLLVVAIGVSGSMCATTIDDADSLQASGPEWADSLACDMAAAMAPTLISWESNDHSDVVKKLPLVPPKTDKYRLTWMRTNEGVQPYKFMHDLTFAGVPLFVAGIIAKSEKKSFRQNVKDNKHTLITDFKTEIDNYTQFFGPALTTGLKIAGVEGRSDWGRYLASTALSYGIMAAFVNSIKYTAKEMRPDGSTRNSWPSGHTATAFVGATILHKEYGLTRSPWYSVAGYTVATATGVMRVLNNRHWVSDVLSGAGIGIMSGELAYALSDLIFKGRGLLRGDISGEKSIIDHPSFFSVSMGIGMGSRDMKFNMEHFDFTEEEDKTFNLKFGASTVVGVEGAYFFNKYFGVGGRLRVNSSPIKGWNSIERYAWKDMVDLFASAATNEDDFYQDLVYGKGEEGDPDYVPNLIDKASFTIKSDHLTEFSADLGVYFNLPLSEKFALGSKLLIGHSVMQDIDLNATLEGGKREIFVDDNTGDMTAIPLKETYETNWDYFTVGANNTMKFGTGLSLTYAYKENYAWKVFLDYDFSRKTYTMTYNPGEFMWDALSMMGFTIREWAAMSELEGLDASEEFSDLNFSESQSVKKDRHTFVLGGSFTISF